MTGHVSALSAPDVFQTIAKGREVLGFTTYWIPDADVYYETGNGLMTKTFPFAGSIDTTNWNTDIPPSTWNLTHLSFCTLNGTWVQISELKYFNFDFNLEEGRNIKI